MKTKRTLGHREFLKKTAEVMTAVAACERMNPADSRAAITGPSAGAIPTRTLGKTGLKLPVLGRGIESTVESQIAGTKIMKPTIIMGLSVVSVCLTLVAQEASRPAGSGPADRFKALDRNGDGKVSAEEFPGPLFQTDGQERRRFCHVGRGPVVLRRTRQGYGA